MKQIARATKMMIRRMKEMKGKGELRAEREGQNLKPRARRAMARPSSESGSARPIFL